MKPDPLAKAFAAVGIVVVSAAVVIPMILINSYTFWCLWGWFLQPLGLPAISFLQAMGIGMCVGYFRDPNAATEGSKNKKLALILCRPFLVLAIAWVIHLYM